MRVLILGGTGVISREIVGQLLSNGHHVIVYNRGHQSLPFLQYVEQIIGDRRNPQQFQDQMKQIQCDVVIDMISFTQTDAQETVSAFRDHVSQIIICSSVAAYKRPFQTIPTVEASERLFDTPVFQYSYQKAELERYVQRVVQEEQLPITVIRPSLTYGVGGMNVGVLRQNVGIVERIRQGKPLVMFGDGTTPWNFTFSADLAQAFVGAVGNPRTYGQAYHVTNDTIHIWNDLYIEFGKVLGKEPNIVHLPTEVLYLAIPDLFGHLMFEKMYAGLFDNTKIKRDVPSFNPTISLHDGLEGMLKWYEEARLVKDLEKDNLEDRLVQVHQDLVQHAQRLTADFRN